MKIARIETFLVPPRWLFCRIETDDGLVGWGEPVVEGSADIVRTAVHSLAETLIGADPLRIEDLWQVMTKGRFYRGGPTMSSAIAGIDQALWDIAGKRYGVPVHDLLGGPVRDRVRVYGWVGGDEPDDIEAAVQSQTERGMTAVKMNASGRMTPIGTVTELHDCVRRAEIARTALGPDRDFAVDFHGRLTVANARRLTELLAPTHPLFIEEPVVPELAHRLADVTSGSTVPIAIGERMYSRTDFLPALQAGVSVVQPDLSHAGGISEVRRIASLAETFGAYVAPHCPLGPIALAACLQIDFTTPNFLIQEQSIGIHYNQDFELLDYVLDTSVFDIRDGSIERLTGAGLGIEVDEAAVRKADAIGHNFRSPVWRYPDGSFAEW